MPAVTLAPVEASPARLAARALLWILPPALGSLAVVAVDRARAEADLAEAAERLAGSRVADARPLLERHRESGGFGPRARAGLAVIAALEGGAGPDGVTLPDLAFFRPRLLLDAALRRADFDGVLRLARLARASGDRGAAAYEAAALLEHGEDAGAREVLAGVPEAAWTPGIGPQLARVLEARALGAVLTVADRKGVLVGFVDATGAYRPTGDAMGDLVPPAVREALHTGERGRGVRLGIDADLSAAALAALGPFRGSIVLVDLATGQVLSAVSDARTRQAEGGTPAFEQLREPASIEKIVTTAAALRTGHDPDAEVRGMVCHGSQRYRGGVLWCGSATGPLTGGLKEAFAVSCNIAFANLAIEIGWPGMLDELRRWGFDRPREDVPGAGRILRTEGTERDLASLGIGLDVTAITPLHAALLGSTLATGEMPEPALLSADDGALALSPRPIPPRPGRRLLAPAWVPVMQQALAGVVEEGGTAEGVAPASFPVVMKTGTASAPHAGYHVNYVGAGPLPHPTLGFAVRITHQRTSHRVREAAQEVLATLLEELGRRRR